MSILPEIDYTDLAQVRELAQIIREKVAELNNVFAEAATQARLGIILEVEPMCVDHQEGHWHYPKLEVKVMKEL